MAPTLFFALKAFIERDGKILVIRESGKYADGTNQGSFDVPGGRLQPGEKFDEALRREVKEETGLDVDIGAPFFLNEWRPTVRGEEWQIVGTFVRCVAKDGDVKMEGDHDEYLWIDPASHNDHPLIPNLHPAFDAYQGKQ